MKNQFNNKGYKLLSKTYKNALSKLLIECPKGHQYEVSYNNFKCGCRCPICYNSKKKFTQEYVKSKFAKEDYKLLSKEYNNNRTKLVVECPEGHQYEVRYHNFQQNVRCPFCSGKQKHSYDFIKEQFKKEGYKLLSKEYKNAHKKLKVECPKGHRYEVSYSNFKQGRRCPICCYRELYSYPEKTCVNVVRQLTNENVIENDRTQIMNPKTNQSLELDIYIPSLNKAIEFNGEYWHDSDYSRYKDNQKKIQCKEKNIDLLTIWYQNWIDDRKKQINNLKEFIGV